MLPEANAKSKFIGGVAVLTVSTAVVKIIGFLYKIPLIRLVGMEGMGYYLAAYHVYTVLLMLSSAGLPSAVSILVSRNFAKGKARAADRVFDAALLLFSIVGGICAAILYLFADVIAASIEIPNAAYCLRMIAPSIVFVAAGSAVKGYFQGKQNMNPTALSYIIEAVSKLVLGLAFTCFAKRKGLDPSQVAAYAIGALSVSSFISCAYLFFRKLRKEDSLFCCDESNEEKSFFDVSKELFKVALPISLVALITGFAGIADTVLISSRLQSAGFDEAYANLLYSSYGNLCVPVFALIPSLVGPVAMSMIPMMADASQRNDKKRETELFSSAFRLCTVVAVPAAIGMCVFSKEILGFIFSSEGNAVNLSAPLLSYLAPATVFSCLIALTNAVLQSYGKTVIPLISMTFGAVLKFGLEYVLVGNFDVNIVGAPISTFFCDLTVVIINLCFIKRYTENVLSISNVLVKPTIAATFATLMSVALCGAYIRFFGYSREVILVAVAVDALAYAITALKSRTVTKHEILMLPKGEKLFGVLKAIHLVK